LTNGVNFNLSIYNNAKKNNQTHIMDWLENNYDIENISNKVKRALNKLK